MIPARWKSFARAFVREVEDDRLASGAAALAFYLVLALFPAAIFGLSLLPYLPIPHLREALMDVIAQALPRSAADLLTSTVESVVSSRSGGLLSFGFVFAIWSASNGLYAVMQQLNVVYNVKERRPFFRAHAVALLLTLIFFLLVVGGLGLVVFGGMMQAWIGDHLGWSSVLLASFATLRWIIIIAALVAAFSVIYYLGPNVEQRFTLWSPGALVATAGVLLVSLAFKLYVSRLASYDSVYGGLGAMIVLLMWLYVTGWVVLLGGELNDVLERQRGVQHAARTGGDEAVGRRG